MKLLIIAVSVLVVLITIATIMTGSSVFDGIVVEKPYEAGLAWDKTQEQKTRLGWTLSMKNGTYHTGRNVLVFSIQDGNGRQLQDVQPVVRISRRETARYDKSNRTVRRRDGSFSADIELPVPGKWEISVSVNKGTDSTELVRTISVERAP